MRPARLQSILRARPFRPMRICTSDGASFEVRHPDQVIVTDWEVLIALDPNPRTGVWRRLEQCSPLHVVRVEKIRSSPPRPAG